MTVSYLKWIAIAATAVTLSACAGDGTRVASEINSQIAQADGTTAFVSRNTGYTASVPRIFVLIDGERVASVGVNEVVSFQTPPGTYDMSLEWGGIAGIGNTVNGLTYVNDPDNVQFFTITLRQSFLGATTTISEVTESSFGAAR